MQLPARPRVKTAVAAPPVDPREELRLLLWTLLRKRLSHDWFRHDTFFSQCTKCGWGWKWDMDNDFPCPGFIYRA